MTRTEAPGQGPIPGTPGDLPGADPGAAGGARSPARAAGARARGTAMGRPDRLLSRQVDPQPRLALQPPGARVAWVVHVPLTHAAAAGYAAAPAARAASRPAPAPAGAGAGTAAAAAATPSKGEWSFLDDRKISIEDKLFKFMKLVMKKSNEDLEKRMNAWAGRRTGSSSSAQKKSSGGLLGALKSVLPVLGALEKVVPGLDDLLKKVVLEVGPQLLGAAMIPLGAPWAAPVVAKAAGQLLPEVIRALDGQTGSAGSGTSASSGASSGVSKESDERMALLEIERLVQKQNQMFATISNVLKSMHDSAMTAVANIR